MELDHIGPLSVSAWLHDPVAAITVYHGGAYTVVRATSLACGVMQIWGCKSVSLIHPEKSNVMAFYTLNCQLPTFVA